MSALLLLFDNLRRVSQTRELKRRRAVVSRGERRVAPHAGA